MNEYIIRETGYPGTLKQEIVGELVRCKDCKSLAKIMDEKSGAIHLECFCTWAKVKPDDFCSYGERAEESEQCLPMPGNDYFGRRWKTSGRE